MEDKERYYELAMSLIGAVDKMQDKAKEDAFHARQVEELLGSTVEYFDSTIDVFMQDGDIDKLLDYLDYRLESELTLANCIEKDDEYRKFFVWCKKKVDGWIRERKESCNSKDEKEFICTEITKLTEKLCNEIRDSFSLMASFSNQGCVYEYDTAYARYIGAKECLDYVETNFRDKRECRAMKLFSILYDDLELGCIQYDEAWEEHSRDEYVKVFRSYMEYVKDIKRRCVEMFPDSADIQ